MAWRAFLGSIGGSIGRAVVLVLMACASAWGCDSERAPSGPASVDDSAPPASIEPLSARAVSPLSPLAFPPLTLRTSPAIDLGAESEPAHDGVEAPEVRVEHGMELGGASAFDVEPLPAADLPIATLHLPDPDRAPAEITAARNQGSGRRPAQRTAFEAHPLDRSSDPEASVSVGNVTTGYLLRGKPLALQGPGWRVIPSTRSRGFIEGSDLLVGLIERAADAVRLASPGAVLRVGNLSRPGGGDIPQSVSHNSGRDVDLGFYVADAQGRPSEAEGFVAFDEEGRGRGEEQALYFDSARNWQLVRALLTDSRVQVQYIFVAEWLKVLLLDYAIRSGEVPEVVSRAERALDQPDNSSPHAEHFHVRVYCDRHDRLNGCHEFGVRHPWVATYDDDVQARIDSLISLYQSGQPGDRERALAELEILTVVPAIEPGGE